MARKQAQHGSMNMAIFSTIMPDCQAEMKHSIVPLSMIYALLKMSGWQIMESLGLTLQTYSYEGILAERWL